MQTATFKDLPPGRAVVLRPRQDAVVSFTVGKQDREATNAGVSGPFLASRTVPAKGKSDVAEFQVFQLYDMTHWARHSCVHLGTLTLVGPMTKTGGQHGRRYWEFPIILLAEDGPAQEILTVVDPKDECVAICPHQLLEVVHSDPGEAPLEVTVQGIYPLEEVTRRRNLLSPSSAAEQWPYVDRTPLRLMDNPTLPADIVVPNPAVPLLTRPDYRTYQLSPSALYRLARLKEGPAWGCCFLVGTEEGPEEPVIDVNFFFTKGENLMKLAAKLGQRAADLKAGQMRRKPAKKEREKWRYAKSGDTLVNPASDTWDFHPGEENVLVVELDMYDSPWRAAVACEGEPRLEVIELDRGKASYGEVQRFAVMPAEKIPHRVLKGSVFLGAVRFVTDSVPVVPRRIGCWLAESARAAGQRPRPASAAIPLRTVVTAAEVFGQKAGDDIGFGEIEPNASARKPKRRW